ncbi:protein SDA1 homolog isoform X1 [Dioscorea cayenensis subsp. rotundata]|uniref:Protein SDA1 n=1 Tax=Dioscorea cayennensis subsp. rotundata TaxID=55577 RepID=A0AB40C3A7_DIOCR|nr:protein SDA1 homolog isoform X1 [Dioscorea cayenensis subsp. rotundata]
MPAPPSSVQLLTPETLLASGKGSERLSLPTLQSKMKCDPEGYESELVLLRRHFGSSLQLFRQQSTLAPSTDPAVVKDLGDFAMFLAHVSPLYPSHLADFPGELIDFLRSDAGSLPSSLRCHLVQALILLVNRKLVTIEETLELFMALQILGDRTMRKMAFAHVVHSIRRMNQKHKNEANNRKLQNILFLMLQEEDEARAKRSLVVLSDLHRRRVWFDDRTANAICTACFHSSSRILISALSFLLGYEQVEEEDDSDNSSSEDDTTNQTAQIILSREAVYKAHRKGTTSSKKKKKAKLQRVARSMKKQQRISSENNNSNWYSPLAHLQDAQGFVDKLFSRLQKCNERFEVKMMMLKVIARTVGMHRLILLNFYPFLQKYIKAHQRDVTTLLAAAVQACHDMVPPDAIEPLFRQIVDQFVHDRSRTEAIAVGLNVVREICLRMPLLMNEDLLQDLVLYKKSHEKAISTAARSLIMLFREICPSLLVKKDRGRPTNPKAKPKAFGEVNIETSVPGLELLQNDGNSMPESSDDELNSYDDEDDLPQSNLDSGHDNEAFYESKEDSCRSEDDEEDQAAVSDEEEDDDDTDTLGDSCKGLGPRSCDNNHGIISDDSDSDDDMDDDDSDEDTDEEESAQKSLAQTADVEEDVEEAANDEDEDDMKKAKTLKRKFVDYAGKPNETSLRALKRLAGSNMSPIPSVDDKEILSNEDFQRIKELKAKKEAKLALSRQGLLRKGSDPKLSALKLPSAEQLSLKWVDPAKLEIHVKRKLSKEERLALVKAGREDRVKYQARTATKQNKTGGLSNRQKEHKKAMPLAAKRAKVARSRHEKRKKQNRSGKQFRGKKAWK